MEWRKKVMKWIKERRKGGELMEKRTGKVLKWKIENPK